MDLALQGSPGAGPSGIRQRWKSGEVLQQSVVDLGGPHFYRWWYLSRDPSQCLYPFADPIWTRNLVSISLCFRFPASGLAWLWSPFCDPAWTGKRVGSFAQLLRIPSSPGELEELARDSGQLQSPFYSPIEAKKTSQQPCPAVEHKFLPCLTRETVTWGSLRMKPTVLLQLLSPVCSLTQSAASPRSGAQPVTVANSRA